MLITAFVIIPPPFIILLFFRILIHILPFTQWDLVNTLVRKFCKWKNLLTPKVGDSLQKDILLQYFFFWKKGFLYFLWVLNYFMYHIVLVYEIVCRIYENALHFYGYLLNMIVYFYVLCDVCFGVLTNIVRHSYEFNGRHEM